MHSKLSHVRSRSVLFVRVQEGRMERMLLDDLVQLIERLRERIQQHGPALAKNEMLTRYTR